MDHMEDNEKTEEQLINEIAKLRQQITELKESEIKHKKTEEDLKNSEEEYRSLFENMLAVYYRADKKGNIIMVNSSGVKLLGYESPKEIIGKKLAKDLYCIPKDRKKFLEELKKRKGSVNDYEVTLIKRDGTPVIVATSSHYYYGKEGNIAGVEGIFMDITERKKNEKLQQVLYNISKAANSPITLDQLYKTIHQELGTIIDTTNFFIALVDYQKDEVYFPYFVDENDDGAPIANFSKSKSLTTYILKKGKSLLIDYKGRDRLVSQGKLIILGYTTNKLIWLGVPLKIKDEVIGAMAVQSYTNPDLYCEEDIQLMEFISEQVATAIQRKQLEDCLLYTSDAADDLLCVDLGGR